MKKTFFLVLPFASCAFSLRGLYFRLCTAVLWSLPAPLSPDLRPAAAALAEARAPLLALRSGLALASLASSGVGSAGRQTLGKQGWLTATATVEQGAARGRSEPSLFPRLPAFPRGFCILRIPSNKERRGSLSEGGFLMPAEPNGRASGYCGSLSIKPEHRARLIFCSSGRSVSFLCYY